MSTVTYLGASPGHLRLVPLRLSFGTKTPRKCVIRTHRRNNALVNTPLRSYRSLVSHTSFIAVVKNTVRWPCSNDKANLTAFIRVVAEPYSPRTQRLLGHRHSSPEVDVRFLIESESCSFPPRAYRCHRQTDALLPGSCSHTRHKNQDIESSQL